MLEEDLSERRGTTTTRESVGGFFVRYNYVGPALTIGLPASDTHTDNLPETIEVRQKSPSLFPSFSTRRRMGVILMLCKPHWGGKIQQKW
jgi:hypothetical protein